MELSCSRAPFITRLSDSAAEAEEFQTGFEAMLLSRRCFCFLLSLLSPFPLACQLGFYKTAAGDQLCAKCPSHSYSNLQAAQVCHCENSFYRAAQDPPSAACTSKYSPSRPCSMCHAQTAQTVAHPHIYMDGSNNPCNDSQRQAQNNQTSNNKVRKKSRA